MTSLMVSTLKWLEKIFEAFPLPMMEVWGRFGYLIGTILAIAAFGGFTFRPGGKWGLGRERQSWDMQALVSLTVTFVFVIVSGYLGSSIVLVPGAQTFESLKDLAVFLCILLFGYPALIIVPIAYGISDLIEGVPPGYLVDWFLGYLVNPAFFWIAYQFIGKNPDFRRVKIWGGYFIFVLIFLGIEPQLWGYICSGKFTPEVSYRNITPALFFTTALTWILAPFAMLGGLPIARKLGLFWAEIPNHVKERSLRSKEWIWISGRGKPAFDQNVRGNGFPIRVFIALPFVGLVLAIVATTTYITLKSAERDTNKLVSRLHQEVSDNINLRLDSTIEVSEKSGKILSASEIDHLLEGLTISTQGRAFIINQKGKRIASSKIKKESENENASTIEENAIHELFRKYGDLKRLKDPFQFRYEIVTPKPLSREIWLAQASPYQDNQNGHEDWILMTAIPESFYMSSLRSGQSKSAMVLALFLTLSLMVVTVIAAFVSNPIRKLVDISQAIAAGDLNQRVPSSNLEELDTLSFSFNHMTEKLSRTYNELRTAKDASESASRVKSEFLDIAAHELRTPMTSAMLLIQFTQERLKEGDHAQISDLNLIENQMRRLMRLVEDLLNVSRLERGDLNLKLETHDLVNVIGDELENFRRAAPNRVLSFKAPIEPVLVKIDPIRIHQVLSNLIDNALKYTDEKCRIDIEITQTPHIRVSVRDSGPGIPKAQQEELFSKFYRTRSENTLKQPGLGLGLYICRKIVELHGGKMDIESEPGRGCTFYFELIGKKETENA